MKPAAPVSRMVTGAAGRYCATQPPSMEIGAPVIVAAASEHRNTASAPIYSGVVNFVIGCFSAQQRVGDLLQRPPLPRRPVVELLLHQRGQHPARTDRVAR